MKKNRYYIHSLILFAVLIGWQNAPEIRAQSVELIDSKTGKPVEKEKLPRFSSQEHADGYIPDTKIRFFSDFFSTGDETGVSKKVFYSVSQPEIKKYFEKQISGLEKIIERGKVKKDNLKTFERIVSVSKTEDSDSCNILLYDGGKAFISITSKNLELALEFEKQLTLKK